MDRRFLLFVVLSFVVLMANAAWNAKQAAKRAQQLAAAGGAAAPAAPKDAADDAKPEDGKQPAEADAQHGEEDVAAVAEVPADEMVAEAEDAQDEPASNPEFVTLGSVDAASPYRLGVTLTNVGAGVRRIELSNPRYLDLHDRGGYVGHLELKELGDEGLLVQAVLPGTPAAIAGLKVGDRILAAGPKTPAPIKTVMAFSELLLNSQPKRKLSLEVVREGGAREQLTVTLARRPLEVTRPESENIRQRGEQLPADFVEPPSFLFTLSQVDGQMVAAGAKELANVNLLEGVWRIADRSADSVTFERRLPGRQLTVRKQYKLAKLKDAANADADEPAYHLTLSVTIANEAEGDDAATRQVAYRLYGPNGLPTEGWWYAIKVGRRWGAAGLRDVIGRYFNADPQQQSATTIAQGDAKPFESGSLAYMGVDAQYFAAALIPHKENAEEEWLASARSEIVGPKPPRPQSKFANVSYELTSLIASIKPSESVTHSYTIFAGPKRPALLENYVAAQQPAYKLDDFVYYGWFSGVSRFMVGLLHIFYGLVGNYGIAILMLTVLIRGCMFPVSRGQAKSMAKMNQLRPEMERIKERYKGDQQQQAKAMQDLYRKHNVNPLAGCLPALIQLPVFVGLWRGLAVDVELRQAPLFGQAVRWCSNLSGPDMFWNWSGFMPGFITRGEGFFGLGPYLNLLPLVTVGLFLWQQKMFMPEPANEQAAMQQKIMKYMMVLMGVLFYKVPSGLCLYSIASSLWGIGERKLFPPPTAASVESSTGTTAGAKSAWKTEEKRVGNNGEAGASRGGKAKRRR